MLPHVYKDNIHEFCDLSAVYHRIYSEKGTKEGIVYFLSSKKYCGSSHDYSISYLASFAGQSYSDEKNKRSY